MGHSPCPKLEKGMGRLLRSRGVGDAISLLMSLGPDELNAELQGEPVGRVRGEPVGGRDRHDGLARPRAVRHAGEAGNLANTTFFSYPGASRNGSRRAFDPR